MAQIASVYSTMVASLRFEHTVGTVVAPLIRTQPSLTKAGKRGATVQPRNLEQRMTMLEEQMQALRDLPARVAGVEWQILQLRDEMGTAFSAMHGKVDSLRVEMLGIRDDLRGDIRAGNQESQDFMRVIYERIKEDIKTLGEGRQ